MTTDEPTWETTREHILQELANDKTGVYTHHYVRADVFITAIDTLSVLRKTSKLTQEEVAARMGKRQETISRWEDDTDGRLSLSNYVDLALACGVVPQIRLVPIEEAKQQIIESLQEPMPTHNLTPEQREALTLLHLQRHLLMALIESGALVEAQYMDERYERLSALIVRDGGMEPGPSLFLGIAGQPSVEKNEDEVVFRITLGKHEPAGKIINV